MQEDNTASRRHVRQLTGIPIQITLDRAPQYLKQIQDDSINNVSLGGLSFIADKRFDIDQLIQVCFPILNDKTVLSCRVIWCEKYNLDYRLGLEFDDENERQRLKIIDQISDIENYRRRKEAIEGRSISSEQAAREWVQQYAGKFSALQ